MEVRNQEPIVYARREIINTKSMLVLPLRVRRQLKAQDEARKLFKRLLLFAYAIGLVSAIPTSLVLWASVGHPLTCLFFGCIMASLTSGLIYAWHPYFFVAKAR